MKVDDQKTKKPEKEEENLSLIDQYYIVQKN